MERREQHDLDMVQPFFSLSAPPIIPVLLGRIPVLALLPRLQSCRDMTNKGEWSREMYSNVVISFKCIEEEEVINKGMNDS